MHRINCVNNFAIFCEQAHANPLSMHANTWLASYMHCTVAVLTGIHLYVFKITECNVVNEVDNERLKSFTYIAYYSYIYSMYS